MGLGIWRLGRGFCLDMLWQRKSRRRSRKGVKEVFYAGRSWVWTPGWRPRESSVLRRSDRMRKCWALEVCHTSTFVGAVQFCSSLIGIGFSPRRRVAVCAVRWWCSSKASLCSSSEPVEALQPLSSGSCRILLGGECDVVLVTAGIFFSCFHRSVGV
ncbi:hypothetical protein BRADI_1g49253v3 [Brachypodium distachyon]|uniref:Uncharacterized protein n=1 Tax=Brachypodium distachyon TaxID=15368 RepID=A0A2K2DQH7_BRADI|nr:hypothetical protein BRADI_1g49253v3 [Brachypodium distachyon]